MHASGSHSAITSEMFRFSYLVVPEGKVPSTGRALTGSESPVPNSMDAVTLRTNSGAPAGTGGIIDVSETGTAGTSTRCNSDTEVSTASSFLATTSAPLRAYVLRMVCLTFSIAASRGITLLIAKKQVCSTVLVRRPIPALRATIRASTVHSSMPRSMIRCCIGRGSISNTACGG